MIDPNKYIVAIPSYKRAESIGNHSLRILHDKGVDSSRIFIFVANKEEEKEYRKKVSNKLYNKIIVGVIGLRDQRNFITNYYPEQTCIVELDDDIKEVSYLQTGSGTSRADIQKNNKLISMPNIDVFIKDAFHRLMMNNTSMTIDSPENWGKYKKDQKPISHIWGVYPVFNPYFLSNKITSDLQFLVGPMWGKINRHDKRLALHLNEKEDFERTLRHYKLDKSVFRFWNITIDTPYYTAKGGMQSEDKDRYLESEKSANYLVKEFPKYAKKWYKGKTKRPEIKVKDKS
jgi:hypothetical protein